MWIALALLLACPAPSDADGDGLVASLDCDDDDPEAGPKTQYWTDGDGDGFGGGQGEWACERPAFGATSGGDCDDGLPDVSPGADEVCDGIDGDCDGAVDDGLPVTLWYADGDGDGFGDPTRAREGCAAGADEVADGADCDDADADAFPGAPEVCDGADDDCDGAVDEEVADPPEWYADADGDGHGDASTATSGCDAPVGSVADGDDCDDLDPDTFPGALEVCDGADDDCDGDESGCVLRGLVPLTEATATILGDSDDQRLGEAIAGAGDLDGDGADDLVVSTSLGGASGRVISVFTGPIAGALGPADAWLALQHDPAPLGAYAEPAGDLDGSGRDDLLLMSPGDASAGDSGGVVWVLSDPSAATTLHDAVQLVGPAALASVAGGADADGDGLADLAVSSPHVRGDADTRGAAWIVLGAPASGALDDADVVIGPDPVAQRFGSEVAWIGDVDGDGLADLAASNGAAIAPDGDGAGGVWWFTAITAGSYTTADARGAAWGESVSDGFGTQLAAAGDVDGDGLDDLIVGAALEDGSASKGVARVFTAAPTGDVWASSAALTIDNDTPTEGLSSVSGAGDVDGDGLADVLVGIGAHAVMVLGSATGTVAATAADVRFVGGGGTTRITAGGGDLDGDGVPDVVISSPYDGTVLPRGGAAWIFSGAAF